MTILSTPSPTASWRSWEVIGGGNNRLLVQRRTVEGLHKNKRFSHRLYYSSIDIFPFRIVYSEVGTDFDEIFNSGGSATMAPRDEESSVDDEQDGGGSLASTSRRSNRASYASSPNNNQKSLPPAGTVPTKGFHLRKRFVVAVAESRDEILADWESIKDGWSLTGGAVSLRHWDQFYQGILRLEEQEKQELEDATRKAMHRRDRKNAGKTSDSDGEEDGKDKATTNLTANQRVDGESGGALARTLSTRSGRSSSAGDVRRTGSSRKATPHGGRSPQLRPQSYRCGADDDVHDDEDDPDRYNARRESLQLASSFDSFAANFIDANGIEEDSSTAQVTAKSVMIGRQVSDGLQVVIGSKISKAPSSTKEQKQQQQPCPSMVRMNFTPVNAAKAELWGARVVAAWMWCDMYHSLLILLLVSHGMYSGWINHAVAVMAVVALSGYPLPAAILGACGGFKSKPPQDSGAVDIGVIESVDGTAFYPASVGSTRLGGGVQSSLTREQRSKLVSKYEDSYTATAAATMHAARASRRLEIANERKNAFIMQNRWGPEGASGTLYDSDSDDDVLDDWEASLIASGLTASQIGSYLNAWFYFIGGRQIGNAQEDAFSLRHKGLSPITTSPGLICDLTSNSATRTFFATTIIVNFAVRAVFYQIAHVYEKTVCVSVYRATSLSSTTDITMLSQHQDASASTAGGVIAVMTQWVASGYDHVDDCLQYSNWIGTVSIVGFVDIYGGCVLIVILIATLAYKGLGTIPFLAPIFGKDSEDCAANNSARSPTDPKSPNFKPSLGELPVGGLIFDGKHVVGGTCVGESSSNDDDDVGDENGLVDVKLGAGGSPHTATIPKKENREGYDLRTSIVTKCMDLLSLRDWKLKRESEGVKFFSRPSDFCDKEAVLFTMVVEGANAGTFDVLLNDDPLCNKGKDSTAFRTDNLLTEAIIMDEYLQRRSTDSMSSNPQSNKPKKSNAVGDQREYAAVSLVRSTYRSPIFGIAARDMVTKFMMGYYVSHDEQKALGVGMAASRNAADNDEDAVPAHFAASLATDGDNDIPPPVSAPLNVFVQCAIDAGNGPNSLKSVSGYTRGAVHRFVILVEDLPPARRGDVSHKCRVTMGQSVDPQGRVPARLVDLTNNEQLEKMKVMRKLAVAAGPVAHNGQRVSGTVAVSPIGLRSFTEDGPQGSNHPNRLDIVDRTEMSTLPSIATAPSKVSTKKKAPKSTKAILSPYSRLHPSLFNPVPAASATPPPPLNDSNINSQHQPPISPLLYYNVRFLQDANWTYSTEKKGVTMQVAPSPWCEKEACKFVMKVQGANAASFERILHDVDLSTDAGQNAPGSNVFKYDSLLQHRTIINGQRLEHTLKSTTEKQIDGATGTFNVGLTQDQADAQDIHIIHTKFKTPVWGVAPRDLVTELCQGAYASIEEQQLLQFGVFHRGPLIVDKRNTLPHPSLANLDVVPHSSCRMYYRAGLDRGEGVVPPTSGFQRGSAYRYMLAAIDDPASVQTQLVNGVEVEVATDCVLVQVMNVDPRGSVPAMAVSLTNSAQMDALVIIGKLMKAEGPSRPRDTLPKTLSKRRNVTPTVANAAPLPALPSVESQEFMSETASKVVSDLLKTALSLPHTAPWKFNQINQGVVMLDAAVPKIMTDKTALSLHRFVPCSLPNSSVSSQQQQQLSDLPPVDITTIGTILDDIALVKQYDTLVRDRHIVKSITSNDEVRLVHTTYASPMMGISGRDFVAKLVNKTYLLNDDEKQYFGLNVPLYSPLDAFMVGKRWLDLGGRSEHATDRAVSDICGRVGRVFVTGGIDAGDAFPKENGFQRGRIHRFAIVVQEVFDYYSYSVDKMDATEHDAWLNNCVNPNSGTVRSMAVRAQSEGGKTGEAKAALHDVLTKKVKLCGPASQGLLLSNTFAMDPCGHIPASVVRSTNGTQVSKLLGIERLMISMSSKEKTGGK